MLEGVKVLSFTHYLQGPSAAQALADLGADVVKVEAPKGAYERHWSGCNTYKNGVSVFFLLANRNQRAIAIDLKSEKGREIIKRLVQEYDVVIENFRPGVMDKLGLGYEALKEVNPQIIYCSCSGYGSSGPNLKKPGQDLLIQSMSGLASLTGNGNTPPTPIGTAAVDQHGAILAALGIVSAVYDRERTGQGHRIEASLLGAALDLQIEALGYYMNGGQFIERPTTGLSTRIHQSPYGVYATLDGYITLSLVPIDQLREIFTPNVLDGYTAKDQMDDRMEFDKIVCQEMKKKTTQAWIDILEAKGIWYSPVNEYEQVLQDEQVQYNNAILTMEHPVAGEVKVLGHANKYDGDTVGIRRLPPELGEHTEEVLREVGYQTEELCELSEEGVVWSPGSKKN
ncbi:CaiB/BaiF CoA transferase family protein [Youxingia wuxianensis]|uniref:CoA transferase n=1 Tax=Youxingia wuxianensis TaxID=2763678 RepID=A0A926ENX7_9FIRM|nr:CaiB/BaiF CoA-transferase family protein [Youxingia wuxianensis]MBC8585830.1 CoA transferase [Youxingia wuxianensis]